MKLNKILWGIAFLAVGVILATNAMGITDWNLLFDGWWTLFIIVPSAIGVLTERDKLGNLFGVGIGVVLLLCCRDVLSFDLFWKLLAPAVVLFIGVKLLLGGFFEKRRDTVQIKTGKLPVGCALFSGNEMNYDGMEFEGAALTAIFGGVECDLSKAIIPHDCEIRVTAVFGGVDIRVPEGVRIQSDTVSIFGGLEDKTSSGDGVTVYIKGICLFGGVDIY